MLAGLSACLLITFANIYFFSAALLRPISTEIETNFGNVDILTGEYEIDKKILVNNKTVALAIIGYGAVTSLIFIFIAMIRSLGNTFSQITTSCFIINFFQVRLTTNLLRTTNLKKMVGGT